MHINLDTLYCVEKVIIYNSDGSPYMTWTCSSSGCSATDMVSSGQGRGYIDVETTANYDFMDKDFSTPIPDCRHGDVVILRFSSFAMVEIKIPEIGLIGEAGNYIVYVHMLTKKPKHWSFSSFLTGENVCQLKRALKSRDI